MIFNERLRKKRIENGFTQQQIADDINVNRVTYTNWEKGKREPNFENLIKLASILGTTTSYLLGETDREPKSLEGKSTLNKEDKEVLAQQLMDTGVALVIAAKEENKSVKQIVDEITQNEDERIILQQVFNATMNKIHGGNNSETTDTK